MLLWIEDLVCRIYRHENSENVAMQAGCAMASGGEPLRITLILTTMAITAIAQRGKKSKQLPKVGAMGLGGRCGGLEGLDFEDELEVGKRHGDNQIAAFKQENDDGIELVDIIG